MVDLSTNLGKLKLPNPTILASGFLGTSKKVLERLIDEGGAGGVITKSMSLEERAGHNSPILAKVNSGLLNAVGYKNPGIDAAIEEFNGWKSESPLIFSIVGKNKDEFALLARKLTESKIDIQAIEIVLSCPHTPGYGTLAGQNTPEATLEITKAVRAETKLPLIVKLSPISMAIGQVAKAAEDGGADIIDMGNTAGPGMKIDIERKSPVLAFKFGGLSGPALKPIAIRCVYDVYKSVKVPIIGTGGVTYGTDAIEMFMAGASAVGVGTALLYRDIDVFRKISDEMVEWLEKHGYKNPREIMGAAHE